MSTERLCEDEIQHLTSGGNTMTTWCVKPVGHDGEHMDAARGTWDDE